jgi:hypothetical protein
MLMQQGPGSILEGPETLLYRSEIIRIDFTCFATDIRFIPLDFSPFLVGIRSSLTRFVSFPIDFMSIPYGQYIVPVCEASNHVTFRTFPWLRHLVH